MERIDIIEAILDTGSEWEMDRISSSKSEGALVMVIQLCLTPFSLDFLSCNGPVCHFDDSQKQAYMCWKEQPIFRGSYKQELDVRWLLHVVNFFKYHLKAGSGEGLFNHAYNGLDEDQFPKPWLGKIKAGTQELKSHWKGAYSKYI